MTDNSKSVVVFIDLQNVLMDARRAFFGRPYLGADGQIDPMKYGRHIAAQQPFGTEGEGRELKQVREEDAQGLFTQATDGNGGLLQPLFDSIEAVAVSRKRGSCTDGRAPREANGRTRGSRRTIRSSARSGDSGESDPDPDPSDESDSSGGGEQKKRVCKKCGELRCGRDEKTCPRCRQKARRRRQTIEGAGWKFLARDAAAAVAGGYPVARSKVIDCLYGNHPLPGQPPIRQAAVDVLPLRRREGEGLKALQRRLSSASSGATVVPLLPVPKTSAWAFAQSTPAEKMAVAA